VRGYLVIATVTLAPVLPLRILGGQAQQILAVNPIQLELSAELAATTENGQPAALRITLKNAGYVAADMPMPALGCGNSDGALKLQIEWRSSDPSNSSGIGWGCASGMSDRPSLIHRARDEWIRLQPGEFLTVTMNVRERLGHLGPGTVNYWVEYEPSALKTSELQQLRQAGYMPPTERLKTTRANFRVD